MSENAVAIAAEGFDRTVDLPVRRIQPAHGLVPLELGELWEYRELLYFLTWRQIKIRYKQTALGVAWAMIQPVFTMLIFSVVFGRFGRMPSEGVPYPIFAFCALLPWQLFSYALTESSNSLVADRNLITKVYFPRLIVPMAAICVGLADYVIAFVVLVALMLYYGVVPPLAVVTLPLWTLLASATALSAGVWLSALNVRYRDVRYTLPFLSQLWLFATPVAYPLSIVPPQWRPLFALNPMVGVVEGFRWAMLGHGSASVLPIAISSAVVVVVLTGGLYYFRRTELTFADMV
jgi:lipopolysaccharide transport system permease protein